MTVEQAFYSLLKAAAPGVPVVMSYAPREAALPIVVYTMQGPVDLAPSLSGSSRVHEYAAQVDVWAEDAGTAASIGSALRAYLVDKSSSAGGVVIREVEIDGGFDDAEPGDSQSPVTYYRRATNVTFYVEADQ